MSYQRLIIAGNLGRDPETRYLPSGTAVCNFSVAVGRKFTKSNGERVDETMWMRVSAFGKLAETCAQYLAKGKEVLVDGRLNVDPETGGPRVYEKKNGGGYGSSFEMTADTVTFMSGGRAADTDRITAEDITGSEDDTDEFSIPF